MALARAAASTLTRAVTHPNSLQTLQQFSSEIQSRNHRAPHSPLALCSVSSPPQVASAARSSLLPPYQHTLALPEEPPPQFARVSLLLIRARMRWQGLFPLQLIVRGLWFRAVLEDDTCIRAVGLIKQTLQNE